MPASLLGQVAGGSSSSKAVDTEAERGLLSPLWLSLRRKNFFLDCRPHPTPWTDLPSYFINLNLVMCPFPNPFLAGGGGRQGMGCPFDQSGPAPGWEVGVKLP